MHSKFIRKRVVRKAILNNKIGMMQMDFGQVTSYGIIGRGERQQDMTYTKVHIIYNGCL